MVNVPAVAGVKSTAIFVEPKPLMVKVAGETRENGPELRVTVPFVNAVEPEFVSVKLACALEPTATVPKLKVGGKTASCGDQISSRDAFARAYE